jgi:hypothetical protein
MRKRSELVALAAFVAFTAFFVAPVVRGGEAEVQRFLREYPAAIERQEQAFARCRGRCIITGPVSLGAPSDITEDTSFAVSGKNELFDESKSRRGATPPWRRRVFCVADQTAFAVAQFRDRSDYVLFSLGNGEMMRDLFDSGIGRFLRAPHSLYFLTLSKIMSFPTFRLRSVEAVNRGSKRLLRATLSWGDPEHPYLGVLDLDPALCWAVVHGEFHWSELPDAGVVTTDVEYGPVIDGVPAPRQVTMKDSLFPKGTPPRKCVFKEFEFAEVSPSLFTLAHYGLSEPAARRRWMMLDSSTVWLIVLALAGLGCAFAMRWAARRLLGRTS